MWDNVCILLGHFHTYVNENNFEETDYTETEIFCNEKSVTSDEFYKSSQLGSVIKVVLEVNLIDYNKEKLVKYEGTTYEVERTYKVNRDTIELHLKEYEGMY